MQEELAAHHLVFHGLSDDTDETLRKVKSVLVGELELGVEEVRSAFEELPAVLCSAFSSSDLQHFLESLTTAGAEVEIVEFQPANSTSADAIPSPTPHSEESSTGREATVEHEAEFDFEFDLDELNQPSETKQRIYDLSAELGDADDVSEILSTYNTDDSVGGPPQEPPSTTSPAELDLTIGDEVDEELPTPLQHLLEDHALEDNLALGPDPEISELDLTAEDSTPTSTTTLDLEYEQAEDSTLGHLLADSGDASTIGDQPSTETAPDPPSPLDLTLTDMGEDTTPPAPATEAESTPTAESDPESEADSGLTLTLDVEEETDPASASPSEQIVQAPVEKPQAPIAELGLALEEASDPDFTSTQESAPEPKSASTPLPELKSQPEPKQNTSQESESTPVPATDSRSEPTPQLAQDKLPEKVTEETLDHEEGVLLDAEEEEEDTLDQYLSCDDDGLNSGEMLTAEGGAEEEEKVATSPNAKHTVKARSFLNGLPLDIVLWCVLGVAISGSITWYLFSGPGTEDFVRTAEMQAIKAKPVKPKKAKKKKSKEKKVEIPQIDAEPLRWWSRSAFNGHEMSAAFITRGKSVQSLNLTAKTPPSPELTPEEIVSGKTRQSWIARLEVAENKFKTEPNGEFTSETKTKVYISDGNSRKRVIAKGLIIGKLDDSGSQIEAKLIVANGWPLTKDAQPKPVKTEDGVIYTFVYTGEVAATPTRQKKENKDKAS